MLHETIRLSRVTKNYTQEYVAECLGINQSSYSRCENGVQQFGIKHLFSLSKLLDISLDNLRDLGSQKVENTPTKTVYLRSQNSYNNELNFSFTDIDGLKKELANVGLESPNLFQLKSIIGKTWQP
jgi:transcriptional regulator with XRE-family HTH domain